MWVRQLFLLCFLFLLLSKTILASEAEEKFSFHAQATYIGQFKPDFKSTYSSANSLSSANNYGYTLTNTYYLGFRPFKNTEIFFNPEITQGIAFNNALVGLGGFYNGEITRTSGTNPKLYRQRLFLRQNFNLGGEFQKLESKANQHEMLVSKKRFVITAGNFSALDIVDNNTYAKDPRTQFLNWGNMSYAAYDYAADARGFGWGIFGELYLDDWTYRFGRMTPPQKPNMLKIDTKFSKHYGDQFEIEHAHFLGDLSGKLRILFYRNRQIMAKYSDALTYLENSQICNIAPIDKNQTIFCVRDKERYKYGVGFNLEQQLNSDLGFFSRYMWSDGKTETLAFTEVDRSLAFGLSLKGNSWLRSMDNFGLSYLRNELSNERRSYLRAGGMSFFIGDISFDNLQNNFSYSPEQIIEAYYSWGINKYFALSFDYQKIFNPAYNSNRGSVDIYGLRAHAEF